METLLTQGVDITIRDLNGNTALIWAVRNGHLEAVQRLLVAGARVEESDSKGDSTLAIAARQGNDPMFQLLLDALTGSSKSHRLTE